MTRRHETLEPIELGELERLVADRAVEVIDVREPYERDAGYIPGSRNIPFRVIGDFADDLAGGRPLVTVCEMGSAPRSQPVCSLRRASSATPAPRWRLRVGTPRQPDGGIQALRHLADALHAVTPALHREERRSVSFVAGFERQPDLGLVDGDRRASRRCSTSRTLMRSPPRSSSFCSSPGRSGTRVRTSR